MTEREFSKWLEDYTKYFPGLAAYTQRLPERAATIKGWYRTLQSFELPVLAAVTDRMVAGKLAPLEATDFINFAVKIRGLANQVYEELNRGSRREEWRLDGSAWQEVTGGSMRDCFLAANAARQLCRFLEKDQYEETQVTKAVILLRDAHDDAERHEARQVLEHYGVTEEMVRRQLAGLPVEQEESGV